MSKQLTIERMAGKFWVHSEGKVTPFFESEEAFEAARRIMKGWLDEEGLADLSHGSRTWSNNPGGSISNGGEFTGSVRQEDGDDPGNPS